MKAAKVVVVGSGSWGTALAHIFADAQNEVRLWGRDLKVLQEIDSTHQNLKYLKGLLLNERIKTQSDLAKGLAWAEVIVCSVPTQQIRSVFEKHFELLKGKMIVNASKGIEQGTHQRVSEIFMGLQPDLRYVVLSGPSFAEEAVKQLPTAVTVASNILSEAQWVQERVSTAYFRAYTTNDVIGVELAGAMKNIVAIASGVVSGLNLGFNAQAALINRGMTEIARLGRPLGAEPLTFLGLAGMGDLVLTCTGPLSRNRRFGQMIGEGKSIPDIMSQLGGVAEGYYTSKSAFELAKMVKVEMPITEQVYALLYEGATAKEAVTNLMNRELRNEWE